MLSTTPPNLSPSILNGTSEGSPMTVKRQKFSFDAGQRPTSYYQNPQILTNAGNGRKTPQNSYIGPIHAYQQQTNQNGDVSPGLRKLAPRSSLLNEQANLSFFIKLISKNFRNLY